MHPIVIIIGLLTGAYLLWPDETNEPKGGEQREEKGDNRSPGGPGGQLPDTGDEPGGQGGLTFAEIKEMLDNQLNEVSNVFKNEFDSIRNRPGDNRPGEPDPTSPVGESEGVEPDSAGNEFDPAIFAVDADNNPVINKDGTFRYLPGKKPKE